MTGVPVERRRLGRCAPSANEITVLQACLLDDDRAVRAWRRCEMSASDPGGWRGRLLLPFAAHRLGDTVDGELGELARRLRRRNWAHARRNLALVADLVELLPASAAPLVFKGAVLAEGVFPAGLRSMDDVDLAVGADAFEPTIDAMLAAGWVPTDRLVGREVARATTFADPFDRTVDLHRWPLFPRGTRRPDDGIWERSLAGDGALTGVRVPAPADAVVLAIVHGLSPVAPSAVRWPLDVAMIVSREAGGASWASTPDCWDEVAASAEDLGVSRLVGLALDWCRAELDLPVPAEWCERLRSAPYPWVLRSEWAAMRVGLPVRSNFRSYVDGSRRVGRHPSLREYAGLRARQTAESWRRGALISRRWERARTTIRAVRR